MSVAKDGKIFVIFAMEVGCLNEKIIVDKALDEGFDIEKVSEQEYEEFGKEIQISK